MSDDKTNPDSLTGGASPQHIEHGAHPTQRPTRPIKPPTGPSGVSDAVAAQTEE